MDTAKNVEDVARNARKKKTSAFLLSGPVIFVNESQFRVRKKKTNTTGKTARLTITSLCEAVLFETKYAESREFKLSPLKYAFVLKTHQGCSDIARLTPWKLPRQVRKGRKRKPQDNSYKHLRTEHERWQRTSTGCM